jgi:riboflavin biosynthesis pyrimidine reductase
VIKDDNHLIITSCVIEKTSLQKVDLKTWESPTKTKVCLKRLLKKLAKDGITSVLVEPGPTLYKALKKQGLIDELIIFRSTKKMGQGISMKLN